VYRLKRQAQSSPQLIYGPSRTFEAKFSPNSNLNCQDALKGFHQYGDVKKVRLIWTPDDIRVRVNLDDDNSIQRLLDLPSVSLNGFQSSARLLDRSRKEKDFEGPCLYVSAAGRAFDKRWISTDEIRDVFGQYGDIRKILLNLKRYPQAWWCLISFSNYQAVEDACRQSEHHIKNLITHCRIPSTLHVNPAFTRKLRLNINDLSPSMRARDLFDHFSQYGKIVYAKVFYEDEEGRISKCSGFVEFQEARSVRMALQETQWHISGHAVQCSPAWAEQS